MGDKVWVQCQVCDKVHKTKINNTSEDDLYITTRCPCCRDETKHLNCYADETEIYYYYNANLDTRMY